MNAASLAAVQADRGEPNATPPGGGQDGSKHERGTRSGGSVSRGRGWRFWRPVVALVAFTLLGGIAIALLAPSPRTNSYLDPSSDAADGAHALADILGERGFEVIRVDSPSAALTATGVAGSAGSGPAAAILVITSPDLLTASQLRTLSQSAANLFLVAPGAATLGSLAPAASLAASPGSVGQVLPECNLRAASLAGPADTAGNTYLAPPGAAACYPVGGDPSLVRYRAGGRTITIIGSGDLLSNDLLAQAGNAALVLDLLSGPHRIVWLTPQPPLAIGGTSGAARSSPQLIPRAAQLVAWQLGVAVLLTVIWRGRRFGPLIAERLPVVVRASETVEGHARMYQARRARARTARALREAMVSRVLPVLGLAKGTPDEAVTDQLATRSALSRPQVEAIVYGTPPTSDAELMALARSLDQLERQVRSQ